MKEQIEKLQRSHIKNMHSINDEWAILAEFIANSEDSTALKTIKDMHTKVEKIINNETK